MWLATAPYLRAVVGLGWCLTVAIFSPLILLLLFFSRVCILNVDHVCMCVCMYVRMYVYLTGIFRQHGWLMGFFLRFFFVALALPISRALARLLSARRWHNEQLHLKDR